MQYLKCSFSVSSLGDYRQDLLIDDLAAIGFDSFEDTEKGFDAFIPEKDFNDADFQHFKNQLESDFVTHCELQSVENKNWNLEWEKNFQPISIGNICHVRANFHPHQAQYPIEIIIDPKMSFGTGHHQTTALMMELMLDIDFKQKKVLDMGCGTGILAILAAKLGAQDITAIDFDEICVESTIDNANINNIPALKTIYGGKEVIPQEDFEIIIANINRNILMDQIPAYAAQLTVGGYLFLSGFYKKEDLDIINNRCKEYEIQQVTHKCRDEWVAALYKK